MKADHPPANATVRFSDRVTDYVRYRPGYPASVIDLLRQSGLSEGAAVADIGSGTGIFSQLLLASGHKVFAVEPNAEMRAAAESMLSEDVSFHSIAGSGEHTSLPEESMDWIVSAQAFHWFDRAAARQEFSRILKPGGSIALIWNVRQTDASPFLQAYEQLLLTFAPDYAKVRHENVSAEVLTQFFAGGRFEKTILFNSQIFDFPGLLGRLMSCSYAPAAGHALHEPMVAELQRLFADHQQDGTVSFLYDTEVFVGR
jgi:SAM-dependent methyltransferase